jgi:hypothetical protein
LLVLFFLFTFITSISTQSRLYGPGLRASFQVPVRYFYLESHDSKGQKYVISLKFSISIETINNI